MKKQFNAIQKKAFTFLLAAVIVLSSSATLYALPGVGTGEAKQAEIVYKGIQDKFLVFNIDYKNETNEDFFLIIRNEFSEVLFSRKYDAKPLTTNILLSDIPDDARLTFTIKTGKKEFVQGFRINSSVKLVADYDVKVIQSK
ncbi:MAG TPA: hypothetical protein VF610_01340 [Segetibacter sp.]|jgi:hypothetical protein